MLKNRAPIKNSLWRVFAVAALATGLVMVLPFAAGTASAHHSAIAADVDCDGLVSWTATSWYPQHASDHRGENPDIRVYLQIEDQASVQIASGAFTQANGYHFSGTFAWPLDDTNHLASYVYVSAKPNANWGNGNTSRDGQSVKVYPPSGCPGEPTAGVQDMCVLEAPGYGSGTAVVTLSNGDDPWGASVEFRVYDPDQTTIYRSYVVNPGVDRTVTFTGLEPDGVHTIKVSTKHSYPGFPTTFNVDVDCDSPVPALTLTPGCVDALGNVLVTMTNTGGEAVTFDVTNPLNLQVWHVVVAAGATETLTFVGFGNGTYNVPVMAGTVDLSDSFTVACAVPGTASVESSQACLTEDGMVEVHLIATGGTVPTAFLLDGTEYLVGPDGAEIVQITGLADGEHTIAVTSGDSDFSFVVTVACDEDEESEAELPDTGSSTLALWPAMAAVGGGGLLLALRRVRRHTVC